MKFFAVVLFVVASSPCFASDLKQVAPCLRPLWHEIEPHSRQHAETLSTRGAGLRLKREDFTEADMSVLFWFSVWLDVSRANAERRLSCSEKELTWVDTNFRASMGVANAPRGTNALWLLSYLIRGTTARVAASTESCTRLLAEARRSMGSTPPPSWAR